MRPTDYYPKMMIDELVRLVRLDPDWVTLKINYPLKANPDLGDYTIHSRQHSWLWSACQDRAEDAMVLLCLSAWLKEGPKVFKPTLLQQQTLEQVEVNLTLADYAQPYPAMMVDVDCPPFYACLCTHNTQDGWAGFCVVAKNASGICTSLINDNQTIDQHIHTFQSDVESELAEPAARAFRIAANSCLALANYGAHLSYLFPKEVESDRRLAKEKSERGARASQRLPLAVQVVSFSQEVVVRKALDRINEATPPSGKQMPPHWRRAHWANYHVGTGRNQVKKVLRPRVMVRKDLFTGLPCDTAADYRG